MKMHSRLLALSLVATLMLVFASVAEAADQATPVNDGPSGRRPVVTTTATSTPSAEPTNTVGPDGQKLRKPTAQEAHDIDPKSWPNATGADCISTLKDPSADRFAFVGVCESGLNNTMKSHVCSDGAMQPNMAAFVEQYLSQTNAGSKPTPESRKAAYDRLSQNSDVSWPVFAMPYDGRLSVEWKRGDVPQGVPFAAPDLLTILTRVDCQLPI